MKRYYEFAGVKLEVFVPEQWSSEDERVMKAFRVDKLENADRFQFEVVEELAPPYGELKANQDGLKIYLQGNEQQRYIGSVRNGWDNAYIRVVHQDREHRVQVKAEECRGRIGIKTILKAMAAEHLVLDHDGVMFHAAFIVVDGKAILFTAPSETGKTTQAELWKKYRDAEIINGDRTVIRLIDGNAYACGIPFAGSSRYCENKTVPIEAIVYLGQAQESSIERLDYVNGFKRILEGCTVNNWDQEDVRKAFDIVHRVVKKVPVYHLKCTPDESPVIALEKILEKRKGH